MASLFCSLQIGGKQVIINITLAAIEAIIVELMLLTTAMSLRVLVSVIREK